MFSKPENCPMGPWANLRAYLKMNKLELPKVLAKTGNFLCDRMRFDAQSRTRQSVARFIAVKQAEDCRTWVTLTCFPI
jgi:hypothetical protein